MSSSVTRYFFLFASWAAIGSGGYVYGLRHAAVDTPATGIVSAQNAIIENGTAPRGVSVDFSLFWKVWSLVKEKHIDNASLDANKMLYSAINGMLSATGDPYTTFFDPENNKAFSEKLAGNFDGIGAEMGMKNDVLSIIAPLDDMPAQKAGLRASDKVFKIDGADASSLTLEQAVAKIRGPKGTDVTLTIFRDGETDTKDITVTRDTIIVKTVKVDFKDGGIAVIRVSQFGEATKEEFHQAVADIQVKQPTGIVVDLRSNPGGLLDAAVGLAGHFLFTGSTVVMEDDSSGKRTTLTTSGPNEFGRLPIVVLIDGGSASASEILAGALKDNRPNDVTLVGTKSFGKGSVQEPIELPRDTMVKITIAHWLTPSGKQINKIGIAPDTEVKFTPDDYKNNADPQMDKALEILHGKIGK